MGGRGLGRALGQGVRGAGALGEPPRSGRSEPPERWWPLGEGHGQTPREGASCGRFAYLFIIGIIVAEGAQGLCCACGCPCAPSAAIIKVPIMINRRSNPWGVISRLFSAFWGNWGPKKTKKGARVLHGPVRG